MLAFLIKGVKLVPLALYPWVSGSFLGTIGDHIGPCKGHVRGTSYNHDLRNTTQEPLTLGFRLSGSGFRVSGSGFKV